MAFSFLALLEVDTRKAESFKFWCFFPQRAVQVLQGQTIQMCHLQACTHHCSASLNCPGVSFQALSMLSSWACMHNFNNFFLMQKIKALFALPLQLELPPPYLGSGTASSARLLSQPNTAQRRAQHFPACCCSPVSSICLIKSSGLFINKPP